MYVVFDVHTFIAKRAMYVFVVVNQFSKNQKKCQTAKQFTNAQNHMKVTELHSYMEKL